MNDSGQTVGPPTEKTLRNIREAKAFELWWGPYHVEWKPWVGWVTTYNSKRDEDFGRQRRWFFFWPSTKSLDMEFWNEGPVRWWRCYWLTFGISSTRMLPERRRDWATTRGTIKGRRRFDATVGTEIDYTDCGPMDY